MLIQLSFNKESNIDSLASILLSWFVCLWHSTTSAIRKGMLNSMLTVLYTLFLGPGDLYDCIRAKLPAFRLRRDW
jgi:hypothetical protein